MENTPCIYHNIMLFTYNTIYYFILQLLTVEEDGLMGRHIETCLPCRCSSGQWQLPHPEGF